MQKLVLKRPLDKHWDLWMTEKKNQIENLTHYLNSVSYKIDRKSFEICMKNLLNSEQFTVWKCLILSLTWCCNGNESVQQTTTTATWFWLTFTGFTVPKYFLSMLIFQGSFFILYPWRTCTDIKLNSHIAMIRCRRRFRYRRWKCEIIDDRKGVERHGIWTMLTDKFTLWNIKRKFVVASTKITCRLNGKHKLIEKKQQR